MRKKTLWEKEEGFENSKGNEKYLNHWGGEKFTVLSV